MLDVEGLELAAADRERLAHPLVGGVILFTRNYADPAQLAALTASIRAMRDPALLVAVDHEGGRVQRFRAGFTAIPPMRLLGETWDRDVAQAARDAEALGRTIAGELRPRGIDFSFTPVLDLDFGSSGVIGDRAFHRNPNAVAHLASALRRGLNAGGMAAVGKHFPGHGFVAADSHTDVPVDGRPMTAIAADDLVPFGALVHAGLEAIMPAHVIYPEVDDKPAGYSRVWLQEILRGRLGFDGMSLLGRPRDGRCAHRRRHRGARGGRGRGGLRRRAHVQRLRRRGRPAVALDAAAAAGPGAPLGADGREIGWPLFPRRVAHRAQVGDQVRSDLDVGDPVEVHRPAGHRALGVGEIVVERLERPHVARAAHRVGVREAGQRAGLAAHDVPQQRPLRVLAVLCDVVAGRTAAVEGPLAGGDVRCGDACRQRRVGRRRVIRERAGVGVRGWCERREEGEGGEGG